MCRGVFVRRWAAGIYSKRRCKPYVAGDDDRLEWEVCLHEQPANFQNLGPAGRAYRCFGDVCCDIGQHTILPDGRG